MNYEQYKQIKIKQGRWPMNKETMFNDLSGGNEQTLASALSHILRSAQAVPRSRNEYFAKFLDFVIKRASKALEKAEAGEALNTIAEIEDKNYKLKLENDELKQVIAGLKGRK